MNLMELRNEIKTGCSFPEITEEQAMTAYMAALLDIQDEYDAFYYFSSMNLLNAFVKKDFSGNFRRRYHFKHYISKAIEGVITKNIPNTFIYIAPDVVYVSIFEIQFSFHNVLLSKELKNYKESIDNKYQDWSGIRLQPPAALIFAFAKDLKTNRSFVNQ